MRLELEGMVQVQRLTVFIERDGKKFRVEYRRKASLYIRWQATCWELDREMFGRRSVVLEASKWETTVADAQVWHRDSHDTTVRRPKAAVWRTLEAIAREFATALRGEGA